jgi:hypothetical protein
MNERDFPVPNRPRNCEGEADSTTVYNLRVFADDWHVLCGFAPDAITEVEVVSITHSGVPFQSVMTLRSPAFGAGPAIPA